MPTKITPNTDTFHVVNAKCNSNTGLDTSTVCENMTFASFCTVKLEPNYDNSFQYQFLRNKFDLLADQIKENISVLVISET